MELSASRTANTEGQRTFGLTHQNAPSARPANGVPMCQRTLHEGAIVRTCVGVTNVENPIPNQPPPGVNQTNDMIRGYVRSTYTKPAQTAIWYNLPKVGCIRSPGLTGQNRHPALAHFHTKISLQSQRRWIYRPPPLAPTVDVHCKRHALRVHSVILSPRDRKWVCASARATARQRGDIAHLGVRNGEAGEQSGEVVAQGETIPLQPRPSSTPKARQTQCCAYSAGNQLGGPRSPRLPREPSGPKKCPAFQLHSHGVTGGIKLPLSSRKTRSACRHSDRSMLVNMPTTSLAPTNGQSSKSNAGDLCGPHRNTIQSDDPATHLSISDSHTDEVVPEKIQEKTNSDAAGPSSGVLLGIWEASFPPTGRWKRQTRVPETVFGLLDYSLVPSVSCAHPSAREYGSEYLKGAC
eukprot:gene19640-biopygen11539